MRKKRSPAGSCNGRAAAAAQTLPAAAAELPAAWDPRPDQVSAVREQYWGTCWDFGGISSLESYLIKFGLADTSVDLSEEDVLWWVNGNYSDPDLNNPSSGFGWTNLRRNDGGLCGHDHRLSGNCGGQGRERHSLSGCGGESGG